MNNGKVKWKSVRCCKQKTLLYFNIYFIKVHTKHAMHYHYYYYYHYLYLNLTIGVDQLRVWFSLIHRNEDHLDCYWIPKPMCWWPFWLTIFAGSRCRNDEMQSLPRREPLSSIWFLQLCSTHHPHTFRQKAVEKRQRNRNPTSFACTSQFPIVEDR